MHTEKVHTHQLIHKALHTDILCNPSPTACDEFSLERSVISVPKVESIDVGFTKDALFADVDRNQVLEVLLNRFLTPRGTSDFEFNNYFIKVLWSPTPIDTASPYYKPRCVLGALTSSWQLKIYDTKKRQRFFHQPQSKRKTTADDYQCQYDDEVEFHDGWVPVLDITREYRRILFDKWSQEAVTTEEVYKVYKARMYELCIVDFSWKEPWCEEENKYSILSTFHADGHMVLWKLEQFQNKIRAVIVYRTNFLSNEIVTCHKFARVSDAMGVLAVGYKTGYIKIYRFENLHLANFKSEVTETLNSQMFETKFEEELWENDELPIEFIEFLSKDTTTDSMTLVVSKHPNFVINFNVTVTFEKIVWEELNYLECPDGQIVGISRYAKDVLLLGLDCGKIGMLELEESSGFYTLLDKSFLDEIPLVAEEDVENPENEQDYTDSNKIHSEDPAYTALWHYTGFALSPNGILGCFGKTLAHSADSVVVKEVSACSFASLFPDEYRWKYLQLAYRENDQSISKTIDVLQAFKHYLRQENSYEFKDYAPSEGVSSCVDPGALKLYLWLLKAIGLPGSSPFRKPSQLSLLQTGTVKRAILKEMALAQERILELHFRKLIQAVAIGKLDENVAEAFPDQACSLTAINDYLKSKSSQGHITQLGVDDFTVKERRYSICCSCDEEISFANCKDFKNGVTWPGIPGYKWTGQTCSHQHTNVVSVLSLLPLGFPCRECPWCGCGAALQPVFDQPPLCPFCEEFMECDPEYSSEPEDQTTIPPSSSSKSLQVETGHEGLSIVIEYE